MPIRMSKFLSKHGSWVLTLALGLAILLFWWLCYPAALAYQEQLQLFLWTDDYLYNRLAEPGGAARYLSELLIQFYNIIVVGALILAVLYMVLHKRPVDQQKLIADNWPDEEVDTARNNMRQAIFRMHNDLSAYHDVKVIDTRSRMMDFSGEVNVTTDADEMEELYNQAKNLPDGDDKIILLKKAFELYRGRLFIQGEDDIGNWLYTYTTHYNQVYVDLTSALLTTLGHIKDYRCIMDYGPRALEIEPGILTAYYWIIIAADETGNSVAREKFLQKASEDLLDEENEKLMKLLAMQNHKLVPVERTTP